MTPDESQLLQMLEEAVAAATRGQLWQSEEAIRTVRGLTDIAGSPPLAVRVMILEGIIDSYRVNWTPAADRLRRAKVLGSSHGLHHLSLSATSWLAHVDYNRSHFASAVRNAYEVIAAGPRVAPSAYCRAALVLAQLCYLADRSPDADRWLALARQGSKLAADSATTSALIFDACALRTSLTRAKAILGIEAPEKFELEALFAESSRNFDAMAGVHVLDPAHDLLRAQIMNLRGEHLQALEVVNGALQADGLDLPPVISAQLGIERLWAWVGSGSEELNEGRIQEVLKAVDNLADVDDVACSYRILELAATRLPGCEHLVRTFQYLARERILELAAWRASIGNELDVVTRQNGTDGEVR